MADDLAGMSSQFTGGDVRPRDAGSVLGNLATNTFFPGATPSSDGSGVTGPMGFGATGEGAGAGYLAASQKLAAVAAETAALALVAEKAILAGRISRNEGDAQSLAGGLARVAVINATLGLASDNLFGDGKK